MKILFVCTGNICRSPVAHGLLRDAKPDWLVDSAGTHSYHVGQPADARSQQTALIHDLDISDIRSRQVELADFDNFDYIFALTKGHYQHLQDLAPRQHKAKIATLLSFVDMANQDNNGDVPDPYYGSDNGFEKVQLLLDEAIRRLIPLLTSS